MEYGQMTRANVLNTRRRLVVLRFHYWGKTRPCMACLTVISLSEKD